MLSFKMMSTTLFKILIRLANGSRIFARVLLNTAQYFSCFKMAMHASVN